MKDIKNAFALLEIFFKTLVRLFNALGLAADEEARGGNTYYEYIDAVHDGAKDVLDSGILEEYVD